MTAANQTPALAALIAAHLRGGLAAADAAPWQKAPAVLAAYVERFVEQLECGDSSWRYPAVPSAILPRALTVLPFNQPGGKNYWPNDVWGPVNTLRERIAVELVRTEGTTSGQRKVGYFARRVDGVVKFYRVQQPVDGRHAGRVFVDGQGSDEYFPVKNPAALAAVLTDILADPTAAARLYASELGRCSRCARTLTDEASRAAGMGPDCRALA
jgi:hypothetical protein